MTTKDELTRFVHQIIQDHKSDRDGGYGLVADFTKIYAGLSREEYLELREYLWERIAEQDPFLAGLALEVLTSHEDHELAERLEKLVRAGIREELNDAVIMSLLRMRHPALDIYLPHIQSLIDRKKQVCAELAHLYRVSPFFSLQISASFFARQLSEKEIPRIENCIMVFVANYPYEDEESLAKLVAEMRKLDVKAAEKLRQMIVDYMGKPWIIKRMGAEKWSRVLSYLENDELGIEE